MADEPEPRDLDSSGVYFTSVADFEARPHDRDASLRSALREALSAPHLDWAEPPSPIGQGAEGIVVGFRLREAAPWSGAPLVARILAVADADQVRREAAIQQALADCGFPVPRPVAHGMLRGGSGEAFLAMEQLPGRVMFSLLPWLVGACASLAVVGAGMLMLPLIVLWYGSAVYVQRRLHALPIDAVARAVRDADLDPASLEPAAAVERLADQAVAADLQEFTPAVAWLRDHSPAATRRVVCHGDYWAGNVMVGTRGISGVIDWACAALAPPELDLAWNRVQDCGDLPPVMVLAEPWRDRVGRLARPLVWLALAPHRWLYGAFTRLDPGALRYFTAFHCLRMLVWSFQRERADGGGPNAWNSARTRSVLCRRFERSTGVKLGLPAQR